MIVRYSATARRQLAEIWRFSRRRWGEARADRYIASLYETVRLIAQGSKRPKPCPEIHPGMNSVRAGSHNLYFALEASGDLLHVVAILHQRMEPLRRVRKALKEE